MTRPITRIRLARPAAPLFQAALGCLALLIGGCGAFADVLEKDGGTPSQRADLVFSPNQWMQQGQTKQFQISLEPPPPWKDEIEGFKHLTRFEFVDADDESVALEDIHVYLASFDGARTVNATMQADPQAETDTLRRLIIEVAWEKAGQSQQTYTGADTFWVLPRDSADGGGG